MPSRQQVAHRAKTRASQGPGHHRQADHERRHAQHHGRRPIARGGHQCADDRGLIEFHEDPVHGPIAQHRRDATQRDVGSQRHGQEHHQGLQVAGAHAHQVLAAATRGQHHPDTEHEAADHGRQPHPARSGVDRIGGLDPAAGRQQAEADDGNAGCQHPLTQARGVAHGHHVGDRAHGAEPSALDDGAEHHRQQKGHQQHVARELLDVGEIGHGAGFY